MIAARSKGGMTCIVPGATCASRGPFALRADRPAAGRRLVAFRNRRAVAAEERLGAQILDQQEAAVEILRKDFRHGEAGLMQQAVDRHERRHRARRMGDLGIGLAAAHRWPQHQRRRVHQDGRCRSVAADRFVGPRRGIAGEIGPMRGSPARAVQKVADSERALQPCRRRAGQKSGRGGRRQARLARR